MDRVDYWEVVWQEYQLIMNLASILPRNIDYISQPPLQSVYHVTQS